MKNYKELFLFFDCRGKYRWLFLAVLLPVVSIV